MFKIRNMAAFFAVFLMISLLPFTNLIGFRSYAVDSLEVEAGVMLPSGFNVLPDGTGNFFITSYDNNIDQSAIAYLDNSSVVPTFKHIDCSDTASKNVDYTYRSAHCYSDSSYGGNNFICFTYLNEDKIIFKKIFLNLVKSLCTEFLNLPLFGVVIDSPLKTAVANDDIIFIVNGSDNKAVSVYNISFGLLNDSGLKYNDDVIHSLFTDVSKKYLYALTGNNNLVRYNIDKGDYKFEAPETSINTANLKFVTDNMFVTSDKCIVTLNKDSFKADSTVKINADVNDFPDCVAAGFDDASILIKTGDKIISRIRCSDGAVTGKIELENNVLAISKSGDKIIVVTSSTTESNKNIALIKETDIVEVTPIEPVNPPDGGDSGEGGDNKDDNNPSSGNNDDAITSDIYTIDTENNTISGIEPNTTFAAFKNNLIFNGYSLALKDANGTIKPGNSAKVATGNFVSFIRDGSEKSSFKIIVKGDVTGTGTLTSRDISAFENYLLGKAELSGEFLQAANINNDGDEDVIDLFLMSKLMQK